MPCILLASDPTLSCVAGFIWDVGKVLLVCCGIGVVGAAILLNVNSAGELSEKFNHWRGRDK